MKISNSYTNVEPIDFDTVEPSRVCLVCDSYENPAAPITDLGKAWLCPICKAVLGRLVEESVTRGSDD